MGLAKDDDVVQAFPANGPDQSFGKTVLPRRPRRDGFVANAHCTQAMSYDGAKDAIPVADQVSGAESQGNASVIWRAIHSAVGLLVTPIQMSSRRRAERLRSHRAG